MHPCLPCVLLLLCPLPAPPRPRGSQVSGLLAVPGGARHTPTSPPLRPSGCSSRSKPPHTDEGPRPSPTGASLSGCSHGAGIGATVPRADPELHRRLPRPQRLQHLARLGTQANFLLAERLHQREQAMARGMLCASRALFPQHTTATGCQRLTNE